MFINEKVPIKKIQNNRVSTLLIIYLPQQDDCN